MRFLRFQITTRYTNIIPEFLLLNITSCILFTIPFTSHISPILTFAILIASVYQSYNTRAFPRQTYACVRCFQHHRVAHYQRKRHKHCTTLTNRLKTTLARGPWRRSVLACDRLRCGRMPSGNNKCKSTLKAFNHVKRKYATYLNRFCKFLKIVIYH